MSGKVTDNLSRSSGLIKAAAGGKTVKRHYFELTTRTGGTSAAGDQFEFTDAFVPTDPTVNDLFVEVVIPTFNVGNGAVGAGLRFDDSSNQDDYFGRGMGYIYVGGNYLNATKMAFNIPAGDLAAGTFTITWRTESDSSHVTYYCPTSTDENRIVTATRASLMITEYKN